MSAAADDPRGEGASDAAHAPTTRANDSATATLGRTGETVASVWREQRDGTIAAGDWVGLVVTPADLDRRGGERVRAAAAKLGRSFDFVLTRGVLAADFKVGWPLHRLQQFRSDRLLRYVIIEATGVLDAEWIAANAPIHGVAIAYTPGDMAARYRLFDTANTNGVAVIGVAPTPAAAALQMATPQITATLLGPGVIAAAALASAEAEATWQAYTTAHAEPPKLRGAHPPEFGS